MRSHAPTYAQSNPPNEEATAQSVILVSTLDVIAIVAIIVVVNSAAAAQLPVLHTPLGRFQPDTLLLLALLMLTLLLLALLMLALLLRWQLLLCWVMPPQAPTHRK